MGRVMEIPEPITLLTDGVGGAGQSQEVIFQKFLTVSIDTYVDKDKTLKQLRQQDKVIRIIEEANGTLALEDADYDLTLSSVEQRLIKLPTVLGRQCLPYLAVLEGAEEVSIGNDKK